MVNPEITVRKCFFNFNKDRQKPIDETRNLAIASTLEQSIQNKLICIRLWH